MEFAAHDGRVLHGQGLSYALANRGADHMYAGMLTLEYSGELDPEGTLGKAERLVQEENAAAFRDTGIVCAFGSDYVTDDRLETLFDADYEELMEIGARTVRLERHFNNQRGFDRADDGLPYEIPDLEGDRRVLRGAGLDQRRNGSGRGARDGRAVGGLRVGRARRD